MFTKQRTPRNAIVPVAGQRITSRLIAGVQSHYVDLIISGTLTIAGGAADAIRSRGSIAAAFDSLGIVENGTDRWVLPGRVARVMTEAASARAVPATRLTSTAAAAYPLREVVRLWFAHPYAANPRETAFMQHDTQQAVEAFVQLAASGGADKIVKVSGAVTATLTNVTVEVDHGYDAQETDRPYFIPIVRQITQVIAGAGSNQELYIKTSNALRAMIVSQETANDGEVSDIINGLILRGDFREIIGPQSSNWKSLVDEYQYQFGGDLSSYAHLVLNFQEHGRLSHVLNPNQDINLRFELDAQPSVAGTGTSTVRVTTVELVADPQLCKPVDFKF